MHSSMEHTHAHSLSHTHTHAHIWAVTQRYTYTYRAELYMRKQTNKHRNWKERRQVRRAAGHISRWTFVDCHILSSVQCNQLDDLHVSDNPPKLRSPRPLSLCSSLHSYWGKERVVHIAFSLKCQCKYHFFASFALHLAGSGTWPRPQPSPLLFHLSPVLVPGPRVVRTFAVLQPLPT